MKVRPHLLFFFLDLTRAFDCVNHKILNHKLKHQGLNGNAINWFIDYLSNRKQFVTYDGTCSAVRTVNTGVPQGSILGPILFLIYINDFSKSVHRGTQLLFADDANHYLSGKDPMTLIKQMNHDIKLIIAWLKSNRLSLNVIKTESMLLTRKNIHYPLPPILINNIPISYSHSIKFLGVIIDHKLNWKEQIRKIQSKLSNACGVMYNIRNKISINISRLIYLTLAFPYLNYCNVIWSSASPSLFQSIITTQKRIIRLILRKRRDTRSSPLFSRLKLLKFPDICKLNSIMFVFKSLHNIISSPISFEFRVQGPYNLRHQEQLNVPFVRSNQSRRFIRVSGAQNWNNLPAPIRMSRTVVTLKKNLKLLYINEY